MIGGRRLEKYLRVNEGVSVPSPGGSVPIPPPITSRAMSPVSSHSWFKATFPTTCLPQVGLEGKESACNAGDRGPIPRSGRYPGEGNSNPLQYSCLENPMDGRTWEATVHGVAKSWTWLSDFNSLHFQPPTGQLTLKCSQPSSPTSVWPPILLLLY